MLKCSVKPQDRFSCAPGLIRRFYKDIAATGFKMSLVDMLVHDSRQDHKKHDEHDNLEPWWRVLMLLITEVTHQTTP